MLFLYFITVFSHSLIDIHLHQVVVLRMISTIKQKICHLDSNSFLSLKRERLCFVGTCSYINT